MDPRKTIRSFVNNMASGLTAAQIENRQARSALLPVLTAPQTSRIRLAAVHGGAGCTTIYHSAPSVYADAGRALPSCMSQPSSIVLVALGEGCDGLNRAANHAGGVADRRVGRQCRLLSVIVRDPATPLPKPLHQARTSITSIAPTCLRLPYIPSMMSLGLPEQYPCVFARTAYRLTQLAADGRRDRGWGCRGDGRMVVRAAESGVYGGVRRCRRDRGVGRADRRQPVRTCVIHLIVFCQVGVGRCGVCWRPCERLVLGHVGVGWSYLSGCVFSIA